MSTSSTPVHPHPAERRLPVVLSSLLALVLAAVLAVLVIDHHSGTATIVGSGVPSTQARSVPPFTSVDVTGISNLSLRIGARQSVIVRADDNIVGRVTTRVVSGTLVIGNKPGSYSTKTPILARVVVPSVAALTLDGLGSMAADGIDGGVLTVSLNGLGLIARAARRSGCTSRSNGEGGAQLAALRLATRRPSSTATARSPFATGGCPRPFTAMERSLPRPSPTGDELRHRKWTDQSRLSRHYGYASDSHGVRARSASERDDRAQRRGRRGSRPSGRSGRVGGADGGELGAWPILCGFLGGETGAVLAPLLRHFPASGGW